MSERTEAAAREIFATVRHLDGKVSLEEARSYYDQMDEAMKPFWRDQARAALSVSDADLERARDALAAANATIDDILAENARFRIERVA